MPPLAPPLRRGVDLLTEPARARPPEPFFRFMGRGFPSLHAFSICAVLGLRFAPISIRGCGLMACGVAGSGVIGGSFFAGRAFATWVFADWLFLASMAAFSAISLASALFSFAPASFFFALATGLPADFALNLSALGVAAGCGGAFRIGNTT